MLLGLIYISDAGFARLLNGAMAAPFALGVWGELYLGSDLLLVAFGVYDLATRSRFHPAYLAGAAWMVALQSSALLLLGNSTWKGLSLHLIGHWQAGCGMEGTPAFTNGRALCPSNAPCRRLRSSADPPPVFEVASAAISAG
jgi:hypothetical protein